MDHLCDPFAEGQICDDVSNVALDLTGAMGKSAITSSAMSVTGRAFAIAASFLPHHTSHPEQLVCQSVLLLVAATVLPRIFKLKPPVLRLPFKKDVLSRLSLAQQDLAGLSSSLFQRLLLTLSPFKREKLSV